MSTPTYPGDRENNPSTNNYPSRGLSILNQPAGGIEFVNTKDDEMVTFYHKNGTLMRFHKYGTDCLHTLTKRETIQGDLMIEVNGNVLNIYDKDLEIINLGDVLQKVGDVDKWQTYFEQYKNLISPIHDTKRLFELQRVGNINIIDQAPNQTQSGTPCKCPIEQTQGTFLYTTSPSIYTPAIKGQCLLNLPQIVDLQTAYNSVTNTSDFCFSCGGTHISPSSQDGSWNIEPLKENITSDKNNIQQQLFDIEKHLGQNKHPNGGSLIQKIAKDYVGVVGLSFNDFISYRKDPVGKFVPCGIKIDPMGAFITTEYRASSLLEHVSVDRLPGGAYDLTIGDSYNLVVGSNGITQKTTGPFEIYGTLMAITSENLLLNSRAEVNVQAERFDVNADIITLRPRQTQTSTQLIPEQQVLIDGNLNVGINAIIRGGMHVEGELSIQHITAPAEIQITDGCFEWGTPIETTLVPIPCPQDDNGCIDAPCPAMMAIPIPNNTESGGDCQTPQKMPVHADLLPGYIIGYAIGTDSDDSTHCLPVYSVCAPACSVVREHFHYFNNLPLKLIRDNVEVTQTVGGNSQTETLDPNSVVRAIGSRCNYPVPVIPQPVLNSITNTTVLEKFDGSMCSGLSISEGNWQQNNIADTLPAGEGPRTSNYSDAIILQKIQQLESIFEQKYQQLQQQLANLTNR